jgi:cytochrome c oxidase subunit 2
MMHIDRSERNFIIATIVLLVVFATALGISSFAYGIQVPVPELQVDPRTVATDPDSPFAAAEDERLRELAPNRYEVYITGSATRGWIFIPKEIRVPAGATVTFYATSMDVVHGLKLQETNLNMMLVPGEISKLTATFEEPGEYDYICHEYCGAAHHIMAGKLIVEQ